MATNFALVKQLGSPLAGGQCLSAGSNAAELPVLWTGEAVGFATRTGTLAGEDQGGENRG